MQHCLWCMADLEQTLTWKNVLIPEQHAPICDACEHLLEQIAAPHCQICYRTFDTPLCPDCEKWRAYYQGADPLKRNVSIFTYNHFMKAVMTKWKYRGDYELVRIFKQYFLDQFKNEFLNNNMQPILIPVPLSKERLYDRGFNQAAALARLLGMKIGQPFLRNENEKQSKKTRMERMTSTNPFTLRYPVMEPVVLIDDIYTTGRTIRHAAELLREHGCREIYSFTLIRG